MSTSWAKNIGLATLLLAAGVMSACGNVSHKVAADGSSAGELIWPAVSSVTPMHKGGTFPSIASLRELGPGMNKQQIASLIGAPHFSEGVWGVREWNYVFNFREAGSDRITVCQYKILFDENKLARSFYWSPESCADLLKPAAVAVEPAASTQPHVAHVLSADALFDFDRSAMADIKPDGRAQLDALASSLLAADGGIGDVRVVGYTDRLGNDSYNHTLSEDRARSVREYLVQRGVPSSRVMAEGRGSTEPVKTGCTQQSAAAVIACLAPNRRVEVVVDTNR